MCFKQTRSVIADNTIPRILLEMFYPFLMQDLARISYLAYLSETSLRNIPSEANCYPSKSSNNAFRTISFCSPYLLVSSSLLFCSSLLSFRRNLNTFSSCFIDAVIAFKVTSHSNNFLFKNVFVHLIVVQPQRETIPPMYDLEDFLCIVQHTEQKQVCIFIMS